MPQERAVALLSFRYRGTQTIVTRGFPIEPEITTGLQDYHERQKIDGARDERKATYAGIWNSEKVRARVEAAREKQRLRYVKTDLTGNADKPVKISDLFAVEIVDRRERKLYNRLTNMV